MHSGQNNNRKKRGHAQRLIAKNGRGEARVHRKKKGAWESQQVCDLEEYTKQLDHSWKSYSPRCQPCGDRDVNLISKRLARLEWWVAPQSEYQWFGGSAHWRWCGNATAIMQGRAWPCETIHMVQERKGSTVEFVEYGGHLLRQVRTDWLSWVTWDQHFSDKYLLTGFR